MTADRSPGSVRSATVRRARYAAQTGVLAVAFTACCAFAVLIGDRFGYRIDATATREHRLSERTTRLLESLRGAYEIVVAVNAAGADPHAALRTQDVLDSFAHAAAALTVTVLDAGSARDLGRLDAVLVRLVERSARDMDRYTDTIGLTRKSAGEFSNGLSAFSDRLLGALPAIADGDNGAETLRRFLKDSASICRIGAQEMVDAAARAGAQSETTIGRTPVRAVDEAARTLRRPLASLATQMGGVADGVNSLANAGPGHLPEELRSRARGLAADLPSLRDQIARAIAAIDDLPRLPVAAIARVLQRSSAAIVIGPDGSAHGGVVGLDVAGLFPPRAPQGQSLPQPDTRARTEDLITSAIGALASPRSPIVIFVHGEGTRFAPDFAPLSALVERLRLRGGDVLEWAAALDPEPPSAAAVNPGGQRPLVFATVSLFPGNQEATSRMIKLAGATKGLVDDGRAVLVSVNPSPLPAIGQDDPMVAFLSPLGVRPDSARPLLQQFAQPGGRVVSADLFITDPKTGHAVAGAVRGLSTRLPWAVPIMVGAAGTTSPPSASVSPLMTVENAKGTVWAESEWLAFRKVPPEQRGSVIDPPAPDSSRDDPAGPWTLAAAVERPAISSSDGGPGRPQRIVVVGSNGWFLDAVAQASTVVDGRTVLYNPGNAELFDACITWLSGTDDAIAASAQAQTLSLIPNLSEGSIVALRWGLIGGLPLLILLTGAAWRLFRG